MLSSWRLKTIMLVVTGSEMAALDRATIEKVGIPGAVLMENAARGAAAFFERVVPDLLERRITVLAGSGNNAGDGFVLARLFHCRSARVKVVCLRPPERLKGDALLNFKVLRQIGVPVFTWDEKQDFSRQWPWIAESDLIIDALLGTGLNAEVTGIYRQVIEAVGKLDIPVLAVDVPSGLDASTGKIMGCAVRATATASFGFLKIGHLVEPGCDITGQVEVVDIGIPPMLPELQAIRRWWIDEALASTWIHPRSQHIHKGSAGHAVVIGGSPGKTGAASLICLGAARVGAGLVTLMTPESLNPIFEVKLTEPMTVPIAETEEHTASDLALPQILDFLKGKQAFTLGPGLSLHPRTRELVRSIVLNAPCPLVLDADALTILSETPDILEKSPVPLILTPHPGEMARLIHGSVPDVQGDRIGTAARFSREYGVVLVLKGFRTIIAAPDGSLAINSSGNPAMASGGMGDGLTGMIAGLLAQGFEPFTAAALGAYCHGAAADAAIGGVASRGLIASDLLNEVPGVIGRLEGFKGKPCRQ